MRFKKQCSAFICIEFCTTVLDCFDAQPLYASSFIKGRPFKIHLFIEAPRWGLKWGKQTAEAEGMKAIIGLWRSKAINCGEIRRLEWFAGKPSEKSVIRKRLERKGACWCSEEILSMICTTTHGCLLNLAVLCHQKQVIRCEKRCLSTSLKSHRN